MPETRDSSQGQLELVLDRSDELHEAVLKILDEAEFDPSDRGEASLGMCSVSLEHWLSLRLLVRAGCPTSAISLMRIQFESVTRAMWLIYAASDLAIEKLSAPLTTSSEQAAKNLPTLNAMIEEIGKGVGSRAPAMAYQMLCQFRDVQLKSLNSFVHGSIHPLRRHMEGYPLPLLVQIVQSANGLATMAGMVLALLTHDMKLIKQMGGIQPQFEDCLPTLLRPT
jgi:hypothetical protein